MLLFELNTRGGPKQILNQLHLDLPSSCRRFGAATSGCLLLVSIYKFFENSFLGLPSGCRKGMLQHGHSIELMIFWKKRR
ncbi:hypothetical protein L6452_39591 [Arctium lappa]|uniref:Uncharacterized protein n=1 Tax=Arctium lappa TaxID=4217 RepID=A0ACB8XUF3_ARCLA|nr:hypothetical protein L6452_39591 [Arctium lappa]